LIFSWLIENRKKVKKILFSIPKKRRLVIISVLTAIFLVVLSYLFYRFGVSSTHFQFQSFEGNWLELFFSTESPRQWFFNSDYPTFLIVAIFILGILAYYKKAFYFSTLLSFVLLLIFYCFFFDKYFAVRYAFPVQLLFIVLFSHSLYILICNFKQNKIYITVLILFTASIFNPYYSIQSVVNEKDGQKDPKSQLIYRDTYALMDFLNEHNFSSDKILVTHNKGIFSFFYNYPFLDNQSMKKWDCIDYKFKNEGKLMYDYNKTCQLKSMEDLKKAVKKFDSGWIIIDKDNNRHWKSLIDNKDITINGIEIDYVGSTPTYRGYDVYKWSKNNKT
jgi:hypothetical protein